MGQKLADFVREYRAVDQRTFEIVLKEKFGPLLEAIGKPSVVVPFMMPKRVAATDPFQQISDYTGSGPFILKKEEWQPGAKVVYVKNPNYKPRQEPASGLAGGKVVKVDRVEWIWIPDAQTQVNALLGGEVDMIQVVAHDLLPLLERDKGVGIVPRQQPVRLSHELAAATLQRPEGAEGRIHGAASGGLSRGDRRRSPLLAHLQGPLHLRIAAGNGSRHGRTAGG